MWLAHTGFGLPLAIYLLYNYISQLPKDIFESAYIDGATPFTAFTRLVIPLSFPALASFAIFQFLWVWNDLLVSLVFLGTNPDVAVLTARVSQLVGSRGAAWHLLTAGAFISMVVPLIVFLVAAALLRARSSGGLGQGLSMTDRPSPGAASRVDRVRRDHGRRSDRRPDRRPPRRRGHPLRLDQHRKRRTDPIR